MRRHAIIHYENNTTEPHLNDLKKMAAVLEIEPDKLFDDYYRFLDYPYSKKVKEIRSRHNFLQRELGDILGVNRRTIECWEYEKNQVSRETWAKLKTLKLL